MSRLGVVAAVLSSGCEQMPGRQLPADSQAGPKTTTPVSSNTQENKGALTEFELLEACAKDNRKFRFDPQDGQVKEIGPEIDGFCAGYLRASFDMLKLDGRICSDLSHPVDVYLLRSILQEHAKEDGAFIGGDVSAVVDVFLEYFSCDPG